MEPERYDYKEAEPRIRKFWEDNEVYSFDPKSKKEIFSIDTPPPTVSGKMHIGHAFSYSQQDFIARYKRMSGYNLFYPFGTDDNGLATERLIEKLKNVRATKMDRNEFIKLCENTLQEIRPNYVQDWKNLAISCDFKIYYSTINNHCRKISQKSFIDLYNNGREYQKEAPTIWCTHCQTAIAQVELEDKESESSFNDIVFKLDDGKELLIATTRPEMLGSCVAIFAHPDDNRYQKLFNKKAKVPLFNNKVPILPDERADPEKGTGIVMCCTFGDQTDIEWYKAHNLPLVISIGKNGLMTEKAGKYANLSIKEARKAIIEELRAEGLLKAEKKINHIVNVHERCGTEIEILNTKQWFIKYLDMKDQFLKAGAKLEWHPDHMKNRLNNWINGLQWDWCISRQRFFGVPFPVWYCKKCEEVVLAELSQLPVDPLTDKPKKKCKCGSDEFVGEKDVLDTWATSSLTPIIVSELFPKLKDKLFPMSLRPQAHDIISFWLFNTMAKSQIQFNKNPWKTVMISGWALDPKGEKMSKSKGNIVEPQVVVEKYGADALRFWASGSKLGDDLSYQEKDIVTGQKTINKLWNAAKFVMGSMTDYSPKKPKKLEAFDAWMLSKLNKAVKESTEYFDNYEYSRSKHETDKLFWQNFCDYYLEIVKDRLYNAEDKESAKYTLYVTFLAILKLYAPLMPHITEELYQRYYSKTEKSKSIHVSDWPKVNPKLINDKLEAVGDNMVLIVAEARKTKSSSGKSLKHPVKNLVLNISEKDAKPFMHDFKAATIAENIEFGKEIKIELA